MAWHMAIVLGCVMPALASGQETSDASHIALGDRVVLNLDGDVAKAYLRLHDEPVADAAIRIAVEAMIVADEPDRVVASALHTIGNETGEMVTVTVVFDPTRLQAPSRRRVIPQPDAPLVEDRLSRAERLAVLPFLIVSDLEGVELRRWKLVEEVRK